MTGYIDFEILRPLLLQTKPTDSVYVPSGIRDQLLKAVDVLSIEHGRFAYVQVVRTVVVGLLVGINALSPSSIKIVDAALDPCRVPARG